MKSIISKIVGVTLASLMVVSLGVASFAKASYTTPQKALSALTGKSEEEILSQKVDSRKSYRTIAEEAGVLDEYRKECLEIRKEQLEKSVAEGYLTREEADAMIKLYEENQTICDGGFYGAGGNGAGCGYGYGATSTNRGYGMGSGMGCGRRW